MEINRYRDRQDLADKVSDELQNWNKEQGYSSTAVDYVIEVRDGNIFAGGANISVKWNWVYVDDLIVKNRGCGTGRKIMNEIESIAREHGKKGIWLFTGAFQAGGFYEKLGFEKLASIPEFVDVHDEILYIKKLK